MAVKTRSTRSIEGAIFDISNERFKNYSSIPNTAARSSVNDYDGDLADAGRVQHRTYVSVVANRK